MERIEKVESQDLKDLLVELKEYDKKIIEQTETLERIVGERDSEALLRQKVVDKMKPIVNELFKDKLGEFEVLANVTLNDENDVEVKIIDELELWKDNKRKSKEVKVAKPTDLEEKIGEVLAEKVEE